MLPTVDARIYPRGGLDVLSRDEVARLRDASIGGMHDLLRRCALAVLTSGSASDDPRAAQELYPDFDIQVLQQDRGVRIDLLNAPAMAFVDGEIIRGVAELLFAVVRDLAYTAIELGPEFATTWKPRAGITDAVFGLLRNARILQPARSEPRRVLGRPLDQPRRIRLHQAGRLRAGPARPRHLHRLRPGRDEGPDEGRDHRPRQAAPAPHALHRHHRAGHHRRRVAEPDRQRPGDHAGHREAPRGVRAHRPRHHRVPRRRRHGRGDPVPARHPAAPGERATCRSR